MLVWKTLKGEKKEKKRTRKDKRFLIDIAVPINNDISVKKYNKISKYKDQEIEIQEMWYLNITTMPLIVGA